MRYATISELLVSPQWPQLYKQQAARGIVSHLHSLPYPTVGIEVGVNRGMNSWYMLSECSNITTLIGVDHYQPYVDWDRPITKAEQDESHEVLMENLGMLGDRFHLMKMSSQTAAEQCEDEAYDFVFIDGGHSMKQVLMDLDSWYPKIRVGGLIAGHDSNLFSVNFAVTSWYKHKGWDPQALKIAPNETWYWYKT
jgi:predicted O-methyltransferase YrrM